MTTQSHHDHVEKQFSSQACEYLTSTVHASGRDLQRLAVRLADYPGASVLDMGCGAGHASFVAAQNVSTVVAYDLSAHMLDVVAQAAEARQLKNITTRQGYAESLPFADNAFDIVISRYSAHHWHDVGAALREVNRILKPGGRLIVMDVMSPGHPVRDIWLQTVEALRDTSHLHIPLDVGEDVLGAARGLDGLCRKPHLCKRKRNARLVEVPQNAREFPE